ncbi:sulfotransferase family protein [Coleofasciculus sp. G2-EDA-02]|uniref:sulfotransferase family protein n=1 Tax=Coleofasciculus sp. G2-EDA-02 TaxID=3069529 RepID=UPI0032F8F1F5
MNQVSHKNIPPVFIVSSGRAGTTLLRGLLNGSNQIHIPPESDFITRAYPFYHDKQHFSDEDYRKIIKLFINTSEDNGWEMTEDYLLTCLKEQSPQTFTDINSTIYNAYLKHVGLDSQQWGIKRPVLIAGIDRIIRTFPEAKIVHVVRDGRDVALSYKEIHQKSAVKFGPQGVVTNSLYWIDGLRRIQDINVNELNFYELRYEDLLSDPAAELKKLCAFLKIDYEKFVTDESDATTSKNTSLKTKSKLFIRKISEIKPTNTNKYLRKMPRFERFIYELIAAPYLIKYHYPIEFKIVTSPLWFPLRNLAYVGARLFNNWRYHRRDIETYNK